MKIYTCWQDQVLWDPTAAMGVAALAATAAGGIASATGQQQSYAAQSQMYTYQAGIAQQNQALAQQNATYALIAGGDQAAQSGMATRAKIGQIRAAQGASGFQVDKGTMPLVPAGASQIGSIEGQTIRSNAARAAYDQDVSAWQYGNQATLDKAAAANAKSAGALAYDASILGSAASVGSKWLQFNDSGNFSSVAPSFTNIVNGFSAAG
jgi:hypothetical protein